MNDLVPIQDLQTMAVAIAKSGLFGAKTPEQALALMLVAQAEGMHPASAARDYDIIQGKGAKKSEAMLRDFLKAGGSVKWHALDDTQADATFSHPQGGEVRIAWDMVRAKQANLTGKEMYKKFPRQMLRARCVSEGVRTVCPLATGGMYTPEEVQDIPEKDMGAAVVIEQPRAKLKAEAAQVPAQAQSAEPSDVQHHQPAADSAPESSTQDAETVTSGTGIHPAPSPAAGPMTEKKLRILKAKTKGAGLTRDDVIKLFGPSEEWTEEDFPAISNWLAEQTA